MTKVPKGIGLYTHPLTAPIWSGGSVSITTWGLEQFSRLHDETAAPFIFEPEDEYYRLCDPSKANAWILQFYAFPKTSVPAVRFRKGQKTFHLTAEYLNQAMQTIVEARFLELADNSPVNLAFYINRSQGVFSGDASGWIISGPSDSKGSHKGFSLMARYPFGEEEQIPGSTSLDRS